MSKSTTHRPRNLGYSVVIGLLVGLGAALMFAAGFFFRDITGLPFNSSVLAASQNTAEDDYPLLQEVQHLLDSQYLRRQPDLTTREYAAVRAVLATLEDRYTFFIDPPVAQSEFDALAGTYGGIGVQVHRNEAGQFVLYPFVDLPAARAGITDGDVLEALNGVPLDPTTQQDALDQSLRGEVKDDSGVEITVLKTDNTELTVFIDFEVINVPSVVWRVLAEDDRIGYVQIMRFTGRTPDELQAALDGLNTDKVQALVLDLRNNSGGLLQESIDVASQFLEGGEVVVYEVTRDNEKVYQASSGGSAEKLPLVVLVNQGTASASELVAGAIQDDDRGILIGQATYGKGTVQQIFRLSDDSSVHITSAEWLTPKRQKIENLGLQPDVPMIPDANGRDVELGEALRQLQQQISQEDAA